MLNPSSSSDTSRNSLSLHAAASLLVASAALVAAPKAPAQEATAAPDTGALQEVVVSARKRSEPLQEVPIAVTAFDAAQLENAHIQNVEDLAFAAPDLAISRSQGSQNSAAIFIRGIGQDNSTIVNENGVGLYVDGVYLARQIGSLIDLVDIEQVEVLRGPQGTLYGRNNIGGAIKIDTRLPTTDELNYSGDVTIGSFDRVDVRGVVNAPINDQMAMSVSALSRTDNGYYTDAVTGSELNRKDSQAARLKYLYQITNDIDLVVAADFSRDHSGTQVGTPFTSSNPYATQPLYGGNFTAAPGLPDTNRYSGWGTSATLNWNVGVGKVTSISAFRQINYVQADDLSAVPLSVAGSLNLTRSMDQHQESEELTFSSGWSGPFSLTSGIYFFREYGNEDLGLVISLSPTAYITAPFIAVQTSTSEAIYSEGTYAFTDQLKLTVGGRYTHDSKEIVRGGSFAGASADNSNNEFTPRAMLQYDVTRDINIYGSWALGYQEGEYQGLPGSFSEAESITAPQKVRAYEVGMKSEWFEHRFRANLSVFRNQYTNLAIGVVSGGGNGSLVTESAINMLSQGAELELQGRVTEALTLTGYYAKDMTKYTSNASGPFSPTNPQEGQETKDTPPDTARFGANYHIPVDMNGHVELGGNYRYTAAYYTEVPVTPWYREGGYGLLDARAAYVSDKNHWSVELGGQNLTDKLYFYQSTLLSGPLRFYMPPRTWSLQFKVKAH
jgi:iron complex outermembrane receptor protein